MKQTSKRNPFLLAWRIVRLPLLAILIFLLIAMWLEESLIFFPAKYPAGNWNTSHLPIQDAHFEAADGTRLHGWYVPHEQPLVHILFLHGNAGNITHRIEPLWNLHNVVGASVLILDYRGYGKSEGSPNEKGVLQDARAARQWLAKKAGIAEQEVVLLGRSLGGGVAVDLAAQLAPRTLILESTFTSLPDVAAMHYRFLPVKQLMSTRLDSLQKIAGYRGPLLQSHGTADEIVPYQLGRQLHEAAVCMPKQFIDIDGGTHNEPMPADYYEQLREFLVELADN